MVLYLFAGVAKQLDFKSLHGLFCKGYFQDVFVLHICLNVCPAWRATWKPTTVPPCRLASKRGLCHSDHPNRSLFNDERSRFYCKQHPNNTFLELLNHVGGASWRDNPLKCPFFSSPKKFPTAKCYQVTSTLHGHKTLVVWFAVRLLQQTKARKLLFSYFMMERPPQSGLVNRTHFLRKWWYLKHAGLKKGISIEAWSISVGVSTGRL